MITTNEFLNKLNSKFPNKWELLEDYNGVKEKIKCKNLICGHIGSYTPDNLMSGNGCAICVGSQIQIGVNDVNTTRPDLIKYFKYEEDKYKYTYGSTKKIMCICPDCGYEQEKSLNKLSQYGFQCKICSDGISFPNKFLRYFLMQLDVKNLEFEYRRKWTKNKIYDAYFEYNNKKYFIEMDSEIHNSKRNIINDSIKDEIANENDVILIRIQCKKNNCDYTNSIIENINKSKLSSLFDMTKIDWNYIYENTTKSIQVKVWNYYNENFLTENYITKKYVKSFI